MKLYAEPNHWNEVQRRIGRVIAACLIGWSFQGSVVWASQAQQDLPQRATLSHQDDQVPPGAISLRHSTPLGELEGSPVAEVDVVNAVQRYLAAHPDLLGGLKLSQLAVYYTGSTPAFGGQPAMVYVQFAQVHDGLEVAGAYVNCSVKLVNGRSVLVSIETNVYPRLILPKTVLQGHAPIEGEAVKALGLSPGQATLKSEHRRMRYLDGRWHRVRESRFTGEELQAVVDEDTGESWVEDDRVYDASGTVKGRGVLFAPLATGTNLNTLNLPSLKVTASSGAAAYTNASGLFTLPLSTAMTVTATLEGLWAKVNSVNGTNLTASAIISPSGPGTLLFNPSGSDEFSTAQVNGYYHTNFIHDWVKPRLGGVLPGLNDQTSVRVNDNGSCTAYYQQKTAYFFKSGPGTDPNGKAVNCINTAFDTIIYHEYGHYIDELAGGYTNMGLSEGWGDLLATYATGQPKIGEGFYGTASSMRRTADNVYQYAPGSTDDTHIRGQAWAGFAWHLRQKLIASLGSSQGIALAEQLVIPVFLANSPDIPSAVLQVALRDDNDGNLANGTPHMDALVEAAAQHSIPLEIVPRLRISRSKTGGWTTGNLTFIKGQRIYFWILGTHPTTPIYFHWSNSTGTDWTGPITLMNPATFTAYQTDWTDTAIVGPFPDAQGIPWAWSVGTNYKMDVRVNGLWSNQLTYTVKAPSPALYLSKSPAGPWGTNGSFSKTAKDKIYMLIAGATPNTQVLFHWSNSDGSIWYPMQTLINPTTGRAYETDDFGQVIAGPFPNGTIGVGDWPLGTSYKIEVVVDGSVSAQRGYSVLQ